MTQPGCERIRAVGVSGSPSSSSRSKSLVERTLSHLLDYGADTLLVDLTTLPAEGLLARRPEPLVDEAIRSATSAAILVVGTPVYRATYAGQLKSFFDLFPRNGLAATVAGLIATGKADGHLLAIDHGLRPLIASLGGLSAASSIYATDAQLSDPNTLSAMIDAQAKGLAAELWRLAAAR